MSRAGIASGVFLFLCVIACQKNDISTSKSVSTSSNDILLSDSESSVLSYGDTVFSASVTGNEKKVFPVSKPNQPGYFTSNSPGLELDSATGRINISKSESGLRYRIYYVSPENLPIDSTTILIAGIDYMDRIYDVASGAPEEQLAVPIYNMNPNLPMPCANGSNGQGCKFDITDLNNDTIPDVVGANNSKVAVDTLTGAIDLKKSLDNGVFGQPPLGNPAAMNGRKKDVTIYYRVGDGLTRTLKKITIRLVYFQSKALIPESMMLEINSRNQRYQINALTANSGGSSGTDSFTSLLYYYSTPKRPPLIVIVSGR